MKLSKGIKLLDMMPKGYDLDYVNKLFVTLGENGRHIYLTNQMLVDMIYPLLFGITYSLLLACFLRKINKLKPLFSYLCLLPILADYLENIGIIKMLKGYLDFKESTVNINSIFSVIISPPKTIFTTAYETTTQ
jgi:hypothetical protein